MDNMSVCSYFFVCFCMLFFSNSYCFCKYLGSHTSGKRHGEFKTKPKKEVEVEIVVLRKLLETTTQV